MLLSAMYDSVTIVNNTFTGNSGSSYGVDLEIGALNLDLYNNILANSQTPAYDECNLGITGAFNQGNNLIEGLAGECTAALTDDPGLEDLADNGGATQTHALSVGSPAVDASDDTYCPATDQRGVTRGLDGDDSGSGSCDLGAFELGELACGVQSSTEPYTMNFTGGVAAQVTEDGSNLECIRVTPFEFDHPDATGVDGGSGTNTDIYWLIQGLQSDKSSAAATDFLLNLTLPHNNLADPKICKWLDGLGSGFGWDCDRTSYTSTTVTRDNISTLSEWAVGAQVGPTNIT